MTFASRLQGLLYLTFLLCVHQTRTQAWPKSQFGSKRDSDVHIQKSGVVRHTAGEGLSVTDTGIYRLRSRESKYHENYKVSQDPDSDGERSRRRESLGSPWQQEVVEEVEAVNLRDASQEELLAYMEERNRVLESALAEALSQRTDTVAGRPRPIPSHYSGGGGPPAPGRRRPLILPVKVLVNTPEGGGYPQAGGPGLVNGSQGGLPVDSRGGLAFGPNSNNETPEWIRILQSRNELPVAPETNAGVLGPLPGPTSITSPFPGQRGVGGQGNQGRGINSPTPDPWTNQSPFGRGGQDPRTNQGGGQTNLPSPLGMGRPNASDPWINMNKNQRTVTDPWINMNKNQGPGTDPWTNQGRNAFSRPNPFLNANQNQVTNQDPWQNQRGTQGTSSFPFSNQGRNQGTDQRGNQGGGSYSFFNQERNQATNRFTNPKTTSTSPFANPFANQNRNPATTADPWVNIKNQGSSIYPQPNQGRNQGFNRYSPSGQRTNTSPFANQGRSPGGSPFSSPNQGTNQFPSSNRGTNQYPSQNQGLNPRIDSLPLPSQGPNFFPSGNQGQNQGPNPKGQNQQFGPVPLANPNQIQTTPTYPSANRGRNQGSYFGNNQRRRQGTNSYTSPNQRNQNTNPGGRRNQGRNQATYTNPFARNQGITQARPNPYLRANQERGQNSQSIYPASQTYQNTQSGTNRPYRRSPFRKQNDFSGESSRPTKIPSTDAEENDQDTANNDGNKGSPPPSPRSKSQSIFSHLNDNTESTDTLRRPSYHLTTTDQQDSKSPTPQTSYTEPPSQRSVYAGSNLNLPSPTHSPKPKPRSTTSAKPQANKPRVTSAPEKQNKGRSRSPFRPPPEHNRPTPNAEVLSRKRRNAHQPPRGYDDGWNQGMRDNPISPFPPFERDYNNRRSHRNGYRDPGFGAPHFSPDNPFMIPPGSDTPEEFFSEDFNYPVESHDEDLSQEDSDLSKNELHGRNPRFKPRPDLRYYDYKPSAPPQTGGYLEESTAPLKNVYPSLEPDPTRRSNSRQEHENVDQDERYHGSNPKFLPARRQNQRSKQFYRKRHRLSRPYIDSSVQPHPSVRRKRDLRDHNDRHINIQLTPRSFETRVIVSSPVKVERFKSKKVSADKTLPARKYPKFPPLTAYRTPFARSDRGQRARSLAPKTKSKDSRSFRQRHATDAKTGKRVSRAASRTRFPSSRYSSSRSPYYKSSHSTQNPRRMSRQHSEKVRYNDGYGFRSPFNPSYAQVLGGGGGGGRGSVYSPARTSGYGFRRRGGGRGGGGARYHRNQRGFDVPVIENGVTALVQIFNASEEKAAASGGSQRQTGSYFLYNPSTEDLLLVSNSGVNGVSTQDDLEGAYFQYNPDTEELKLVTNDEQFLSNVDKARNDSSSTTTSSSSSTSQISANHVPQGSFFQYNPATQQLKLSAGSNANTNTRNANPNSIHQLPPGAFFKYNAATQNLQLNTHTGTGPSTSNSNSPFQAKVPSGPFPGSQDSQLVGLIQLENGNGRAGGTPGNNNGGYIQFDPSTGSTATTPTQQNSEGGPGGIEEIKIFVQNGEEGTTGRQDQQQKVVGYVVVDGGTATFLAPNPVSGGYIQFSPVGAGTGGIFKRGGGEGYLTHEDFADRPIVTPGPDLFLRMFTEGEVFFDGDAIVQDFYTDGDVRRMVRHFQALPLEEASTGSGFMTGRLKDYHVSACRQCGPENRPMIEFITLHVTSPRIVRRFHYLPAGDVGVSSGSNPYAGRQRHPSLYLGTYPYKNQPQFGVPRFRNQLFDDMSAKRQKKNSDQQQRY